MDKTIKFDITIKVPHSTEAKKEEHLEGLLEHKAEQLKNLCVTKIREAVKMAEGDIGEADAKTKISLNYQSKSSKKSKE